MCEFPSWTEMPDGTILFLMDKDIANLSEKAVKDCCGHSALREIFPKNGGVDRESFPCPPIIAEAIAKGQMTQMMRAGGITNVVVDREGWPLVLSADGDLNLCSLETLPASAKLSVGGTLNLCSLKTLPASAELSVGGTLDLSSLTSLPASAELSVGGTLYLRSLKTLPASAKLSVGGALYLLGWSGDVKVVPRDSK